MATRRSADGRTLIHIPDEELGIVRRYPVTLVLANDGARGDSEYVLEMTEPQILRLLRDDETPRYVRLPARYNSHIPSAPGQPIIEHETRWVRLTNIAEVHVGGGWVPPEAWEWGDVTTH